MPFPPDLLNHDEEIVVDLRPHWWFITPPSVALGLALLIGVVIIANTGDDGVAQFAKLFWGVVVLVSLGWFAVRYSKWVTTNFVVTTDRVIYRVGVFAKHGTEIPTDKINAVHFSQRFFERLIGVGTLRIESASERGASEFSDIRKPSAVQNLIHQQMERQSDQDVHRVGQAVADAVSATAPGGAAASPAAADQIEKLNQLRQQGAITEEEYQAKKAELLDRM